MSEMVAKRKLTTILAADVVGYSKLMATDEEATLATLRVYRSVTDGLVRKHGGRGFSTAGDAFLAGFGSAVEAVRCGIAIQEDLAVRNAELGEEQQMWFRIGINVGDVMIEGEDLFGDGVNVAARLEGLAEKGGICISGSTFDQVKSKLSIAFDDIGAQSVKNIPEPIPAFRIIPGKISVKASAPAAASNREKRPRGFAIVLAGAGVVALGLLAAYIGGLFPRGSFQGTAFDGHWNVSVHDISGCADNSPRSFSINVQGGQIDMPQQKNPKKGHISETGELSITVTDQQGNLMATQVGIIVGDAGEGSFQGRKPGCSGKIRVTRSN